MPQRSGPNLLPNPPPTWSWCTRMLAAGIFKRLRHLPGNSGYVLRRDVHEQVIVVGPLGSGAVRFHAAVRDDRNSVQSFRYGLSFGECFVGIPLTSARRLSGNSISAFTAASGCTCSLADARQSRHPARLLLGVLQIVFSGLEADAVPLNLARRSASRAPGCRACRPGRPC